MADSPPRCLGYDYRISYQEQQTAWSAIRREEWLYRVDTVPLSVDTNIWASQFAEGSPFSFGAQGSVQNLWASWGEMTEALGKFPSHEQGVMVSINLVEEVESFLAVHHDLAEDDLFARDRLPTRGNLLGYDVADAWLTGILSNILHVRHRDFRKIQEAVVPLLNGFHLFDDIDAACDYVSMIKRIVPDHEPLVVYSITDER